MTDEDITLVQPTEALREAYFALLEDFRAAGEPHRKEPLSDFAAFVQERRDHARGINLSEGLVPYTTFWLVRNGSEILGTAGLRHRLTDALRDVGGHIGYAVRPSARRKGYATLLLRLVLDQARERGLDRVLVTCDKDNVASARVIQRNGGRLASEGPSAQSGTITQRYWIEL